jgi:hypothetical protein
LVTASYSEKNTAHEGKLPYCSFLKLPDETLEELSVHDENIRIKHQTILSCLQWKSLLAS